MRFTSSSFIAAFSTLALALSAGSHAHADNTNAAAVMPSDGLHFYFKPRPTSIQQHKDWCAAKNGTWLYETYHGTRPYGTCLVSNDAAKATNPVEARRMCETSGGKMVKGPSPIYASGLIWACVIRAPEASAH